MHEGQGQIIHDRNFYQYDLFGSCKEVEVTVGATTTTTRYAYDMWNPAKAGATGTANSDIWATLPAAEI